MATAQITFSSKKFRAYNSFAVKDLLKSNGWRFTYETPEHGKPHWFASNIKHVLPFLDWMDGEAREKAHALAFASAIDPATVPSAIPEADRPQTAEAASGFAPTDEQKFIIEMVRRLLAGEFEVVKILAYAGTGKTSTLKLIARTVLFNVACFYVVFNRRNSLEAQKTMPSFVVSKTAHATCFCALGLESFNIGTKLHTFIREFLSEQPEWKWADTQICGSHVSQASIIRDALTIYCHSDFDEICIEHCEAAINHKISKSIRAAKEKLMNEEITPAIYADLVTNAEQKELHLRKIVTPAIVTAIWKAVIKHRLLAEYHDVYQKLFSLDDELVKRTFAAYRVLLIDEAQDLSGVQIEIFRKANKPLILVGDSHQSIYGWRGALDGCQLINGMSAPLSKSWRCAPEITTLATHILQTHPTNPPTLPLTGNEKNAGKLYLYNEEGCNPIELLEKCQGSKAIICRSNFGVLKSAINLAHNGKRFSVVGGLKLLCKDVVDASKLQAGERLPDGHKFSRFETWLDFAEESLVDKEIDSICQILKCDATSIKTLMDTLKFHDDVPVPGVTFCEVSTTHKSKGLEFDSVALDTSFSGLGKMEDDYKQLVFERLNTRNAIEEWHVLYVACTRPRYNLILPGRMLSFMEHGTYAFVARTKMAPFKFKKLQKPETPKEEPKPIIEATPAEKPKKKRKPSTKKSKS